MKWFAKLALLSALLATSVNAASIVDGNRIAVGVGGSYEWHGGRLEPAPPQRNEIAVNAFGAYALTNHFSAVARGVYGAGNRTVRFSPGAHFNFIGGSESLALALTYDFYAGDFEPAFPNEWVVSALYARPIGKHLTAAVSEAWCFDTKENRTSVQLTVPIFVGSEKE